MIKVKLEEAEGHLEQLIYELAGGEDVIITNRNGRDFRVASLEAPPSRLTAASGCLGAL